eukprot:jgi/Phyca11/21826/fgenesh1_pg.PHYCAscaffold_137_\
MFHESGVEKKKTTALSGIKTVFDYSTSIVSGAGRVSLFDSLLAWISDMRKNRAFHSIQYAIEESGSLVFERGAAKYASVFNMDQTAINIDMNGKTTIDFVGTPTVDVLQGIPGGPVSQTVWSPSFGDSVCEHTVQKKAWCNEAVMHEWIQRIWKPTTTCGIAT